MKRKPANPRAAGPIDRIIGANIRRIRREQDVSQEKLGEDIGVTFQQVQKIENATNRIAASRLWAVSKALGEPVSKFFEGAV